MPPVHTSGGKELSKTVVEPARHRGARVVLAVFDRCSGGEESDDLSVRSESRPDSQKQLPKIRPVNTKRFCVVIYIE